MDLTTEDLLRWYEQDKWFLPAVAAQVSENHWDE